MIIYHMILATFWGSIAGLGVGIAKFAMKHGTKHIEKGKEYLMSQEELN